MSHTLDLSVFAKGNPALVMKLFHMQKGNLLQMGDTMSTGMVTKLWFALFSYIFLKSQNQFMNKRQCAYEFIRPTEIVSYRFIQMWWKQMELSNVVKSGRGQKVEDLQGPEQ